MEDHRELVQHQSGADTEADREDVGGDAVLVDGRKAERAADRHQDHARHHVVHVHAARRPAAPVVEPRQPCVDARGDERDQVGGEEEQHRLLALVVDPVRVAGKPAEDVHASGTGTGCSSRARPRRRRQARAWRSFCRGSRYMSVSTIAMYGSVRPNTSRPVKFTVQSGASVRMISAAPSSGPTRAPITKSARSTAAIPHQRPRTWFVLAAIAARAFLRSNTISWPANVQSTAFLIAYGRPITVTARRKTASRPRISARKSRGMSGITSRMIVHGTVCSPASIRRIATTKGDAIRKRKIGYAGATTRKLAKLSMPGSAKLRSMLKLV